jgi:hypothetical protein
MFILLLIYINYCELIETIDIYYVNQENGSDSVINNCRDFEIQCNDISVVVQFSQISHAVVYLTGRLIISVINPFIPNVWLVTLPNSSSSASVSPSTTENSEIFMGIVMDQNVTLTLYHVFFFII